MRGSSSDRKCTGKNLSATWKIAKPDELEVRAPLKGEAAGPVKVKVKQFGLTNPDEVQLVAYSEAAHLDHFLINPGDSQGVLTGTRLDEVQKLKLDGVEFCPGSYRAQTRRTSCRSWLRILTCH